MRRTSARFREGLAKIALSGVLASSPGFAAPDAGAESAPAPHVKLVWEGGPGTEGCSSAGELERAVEIQMGRSVFSAASADPVELILHVEVERREEPRGYHARVWVQAEDRRDPGTRELDAPGDDCKALDEPLALVVALMADSELARPPEGIDEPPPPEPPPPPPREPGNDDELTPIETVPALEQRASRPWRVELGAGVLGGYGLLPKLSAGGELSLVLDPADFPAVLLAAAGFHPNAQPIDASASLEIGLVQAGFSLCPELSSAGRAALWGCIGPRAGALRAESRGLDGGRSALRLVVASELGLRGRLAFGSGGFATAALSLLLPLRPETFTYKSDGRTEKVFQMGHLAIVAGLGGAYEFR